MPDEGTLAIQRGRIDEGIAYHEAALRIGPVGSRYEHLAYVLLRLGRFADAAAAYQRALAFPENAASAEVHNAHGVALDPAFQDARINLARIGGK